MEIGRACIAELASVIYTIWNDGVATEPIVTEVEAIVAGLA
jgi:hypothetical protein